MAPVKLFAATLQLVLVTLVMHQYRLENRGVVLVLAVAAVGLPIHQLVPERLRPRVFLALSLLALGVVLGPMAAALLLAVGLGLYGLCHLPVSWSLRVWLLLGLGLALSVLRFETAGEGPLWLQAAWPIAGSMFLFRVALYLHALAGRKQRPAPATALGYFFLLPNGAFPLFPVVDFRTFERSRGVEDDGVLYDRGALWMLRGLVQLMLYRMVYHHGVLDPAEVEGVARVVAYMLSTFLLYLRVSGQFHLIVGLLLLFGFSLPETHHRYFLARSLTDFWRRINIYWKDFMATLVFFPAHQWLRRPLGNRTALAVATALVFVATWALHLLQWLWLTGRLLLAWHDVLFWALLGGMVVVNVVFEDRWGRRRRLGKAPAAERWARGLRTLATFLTLTVLWSLWTTDSIALWWHLVGTAPGLLPGLLVGIVLLVAGSFGLESWSRRRPEASRPVPPQKAEPRSAEAKTWNQLARNRLATGTGPRLVILGLLLALGLPTVHGRVGGTVARVAETLRASGPNARDAAELRRGYYEELFAVGVDNPGLHQGYRRQPADWLRIDQTPFWRPSPELPGGELVPGTAGLFKRAETSIDSHGLRDAVESEAKPDGVHRIAFLGSSHTMGSGVADGETFESLLDRRWGPTVETLNFAVAGYSVLDDALVFERKVPTFEVDAVIQIGHTHDAGKLVRVLARRLATASTVGPATVPELVILPELAAVVEERGARPGEPVSVLEHRLRPARFALLEALYGQIAEGCRRQGIRATWVLLPLLEGDDPAGHDRDTAERMLDLVRAAGFETIDLRTVYEGADPATLRLAPWDEHPNALAHRRIADALAQHYRPRDGGDALPGGGSPTPPVGYDAEAGAGSSGPSEANPG